MLFDGVEYVFTDGAALANGYLNCTSAWGVFFQDRDERNRSGPVEPGPQSNQVAELMAVSEALKTIPAHDHTSTVIVSDSKYVIDCLTKWCRQWEKNGWKTTKGESVKHLSLIQSCLELLRERRNITFYRVNSHQREPRPKGGLPWILWYGNAQADRLARSAVAKGKSMTVTW